MPQKRKRKRTRVKARPVLVLLVIAVFAAGIRYSSLTSLSKVTIDGARPEDKPRIESTLNLLNKVPWVVVNTRSVETGVQQIEAVDHANYSQNIFGRGHLRVTYRVPVARVKSSASIGMDASGVMFETQAIPADLPVVIRPESAKDLPLALGGGFPARIVAELAVKARQFDPRDKLMIWFNKEGALCLNVGTGLVIFGSCDDLDSKLRALSDILEQQPGLLAKLESLNLTEPSHPAKTYKRQRE